MLLHELLNVIPDTQTVCIEDKETKEVYSLNEKKYLKIELGLLTLPVQEVINEKYKAIGEGGITIRVAKKMMVYNNA